MFASFGPRDEALTLPRVIRETARVFNSRRERAPCGSIERRTPGSSAWPARRTFGEASNARCTTGGRCVLCVVARLRVRRTIKPKAKVRFFRVEAHCRCFFTARKKSEPSSRPTRGFPRLDAHLRAFVNAKFPTTASKLDTEIDAELAGGAAEFSEFFFSLRAFVLSPARTYKKKKNWARGTIGRFR